MRQVQISEVELAVEDRGAGPVVVLVHGFPLDHRMWSAQIKAVSRAHRVLAPDLRGFGQSGVTPGTVTMARFAQDLAEMLEALEVAEPVTVCGLSMGGYIAFEFWEKYRDRLRGLVLCDTKAQADTAQGASSRLAVAERIEREGAAFLAEGMLPRLVAPETLQSRPDVVDPIRQMITEAPAQGVAAAARGMATRADMTGRLGEIRCGVLVIVGTQDAISPPEEMRVLGAAIPGSRVVEIPGAGHMSPMEQPELVNQALEQFL